MIDHPKAATVFPERQQSKRTPSAADREDDAIFEEFNDRARNGRLDDGAIAGFNDRLDANMKRRESELAARIAEIEAQFAPPRRLPLGARLALAVVLLAAPIGALLEITIGSGFIFAGSNAYRHAIPWLWGILLPAFGFACYLAERRHNLLRHRYPTAWVRWMLILPLMAVASAGMTIVAPLGWAALGGYLASAPLERLAAKVLSIEPAVPRSRSCDQKARFEIEGVAADICLEGRLTGRSPGRGESVDITGRRSVFGILIEEIRASQ
jgi:hypothetical protein